MDQDGQSSGEFDYVIIGAGSAGCVIANRLSQDPNVRVCLVEAGPNDNSALIRIPLGITWLKQHKEFNWRYFSIPQKGADNRKIFVPRGRAIGGSSSINGMIYMRGHRLDYDEWSELGNQGWSYQEVLPYFIRSEDNFDFGLPYHGKAGPMHVNFLDMYSPLSEMMFDAARLHKWPIVDDFNGSSQEGFGRRQVTTQQGRRVSSATAFLRPVRRRRNLTVISGALAERVTFAGRRATGADIIDKYGKRHLIAHREIVVTAGTIGSPLFLLRSGIGDGMELQRFGIQTVQHATSVGKNLQDHVLAGIHHITNSTLTYGLSPRTLPWWAWQVAKYVFRRKGIFANNIVNCGGYIRTGSELPRPDLGFTLMPALRTEKAQVAIGHGYGIVAYPLRPDTRGRVGLAGPDVKTPPMIDYQLFTGPEGDRDMSLLVKGLTIARLLLAAPSWEAVRGPEVAPGPNVTTEGALIDYIRRTCITAYHPVGTCKMGPSPLDSVVDAELRVHGVHGLRVADASVMPRLVGGNTHAPTVMIAEKASDLILGRSPPTVSEFALTGSRAPNFARV